MIRLRVWAGLRPMGMFGHAAGDYFFAYDAQWLQQPGAYVLALRNPNTLELLGQLGQDLPGVLSLLPESVQPEFLPQYRQLPFSELSRRLQSKQALLVSNDQSTMSLAGAQEKMGVLFVPHSGRLLESVGQSLSTHILKPDTRQLRYQPSAINEYACMQLARALKLPVPGVWLLQVQRWVMFNYLIGNADAHAKNVSVLVGEKGYSLAPFYDLF